MFRSFVFKPSFGALIYSYLCPLFCASAAAARKLSALLFDRHPFRGGAVPKVSVVAASALVVSFISCPVIAADEKNSENPLDATVPRFQLRTYLDEIWSPFASSSILPGFAAKDKAKSESASPPFLHGGITFSNEQGSMQVVQHLIRPRMFGNLVRQNALFDHDFFRDLKLQIAQSKPKLDAEISDAEREMNLQLSKSIPSPSATSLPAAPPMGRTLLHDLRPELDAQLRKSTPELKAELAVARQGMEQELAYKKKAEVPISYGNVAVKAPNPAVAVPIQSDSLLAQLDNEMTSARKDMQEQLAARRLAAPKNVSDEIRNELAHGRLLRNAELAEAKKQLAAVYMTMRRPAQLATEAQLRSIDRNGDAAALEKLISWDNWYAKIAKSSETRLLKSLSKYGSPSGANTISIAVWPNHHLVARLVKSSNALFDRATLEAYQSLDGDNVLQYPEGSKRDEIKFLIDNKHRSPNAVSSVDTKSCTGDNEVQVLSQ